MDILCEISLEALLKTNKLVDFLKYPTQNPSTLHYKSLLNNEKNFSKAKQLYSDITVSP